MTGWKDDFNKARPTSNIEQRERPGNFRRSILDKAMTYLQGKGCFKTYLRQM